MMATPQVNLGDQLVLEGFVSIDSIYSETPAFVVIHRASDGGVAGVSQALNPGWTYNLRVNLDVTQAEAQMSAMLHVDDNGVGTYEFGTVEGADAPVKVGDAIVNTLFNAQVLDVTDQKVVDGTVTVKAAAVPVDSWVVIHSAADGAPGPVLGQALVKAGTSTNVSVPLSGEITSTLFPMLHVDDGAAGTYEFGMVEGADAPVILNGKVATFPIWTVNHLRVVDQIVIHGNMPGIEAMTMPTPSVKVKSVLSEGPGIVVIHADDNGNAGAIIGAAFVPDGLSTNLTIELDTAGGPITPVLWPMLHVDAGNIGVYDGLEVDGVAMADGQAVTFTIKGGPSLTVADQALVDGTLTIRKAIMDAPGWIAIHSSVDGKPGPVIASALLHTGANWDVVIPVDAAQAGAQVFPMLHYDTGAMGVYEFGTVEGADGPTKVGENVVVVPLNITP